MSKSTSQKLKLYYLIRIFQEKTDENHCLSAQNLIAELSAYGICAERKSIYDDIECLLQLGYDIVNVKARKGGGYYLASREFELAELKLLVDAVSSSRFITQKKSKDLIAKIEQFAGPYDRKQLQRQVFVAGRVKTENESIYYNVDRIHHAIQNDMPVTFTYLEWNIKKELQPRRAGRKYRVSPWALTWQDENYYLIAYDDDDEKIKHFRVDKMNRITEFSNEKRKGAEAFKEFDIAEYTNRTFGMFGGKTQAVTLRFPESMVGIILDRFGKETDIRQLDDGFVRARVHAAVSGQFYGWLTGLGERVSIMGPKDVRDGYVDFLGQIIENYEKGR